MDAHVCVPSCKGNYEASRPLENENAKTLKYSRFMGNEYVQLAATLLEWERALLQQTHVMSGRENFKDVVTFAYALSMGQ